MVEKIGLGRDFVVVVVVVVGGVVGGVVVGC